MPSVGYAGMIALFLEEGESTPASVELKVGETSVEVPVGTPVPIEGSETVDLPSKYDLAGVIAFSIRTETLAPKLREMGFPLREDSFKQPGAGERLVQGFTSAQLSTYGLERALIESRLRECPDFGALYHVKDFERTQHLSNAQIRRKLRDDGFKPDQIDEAINRSGEYELDHGLL